MKAATGAPGNEAAAADETVPVLGPRPLGFALRGGGLLQVVVARAMLHRKDEEFAFRAFALRASEVVGQPEPAPGQHEAVVALHLEALGLRLDLADAPTCHTFAFERRLEVTRATVLMHLQVRHIPLLVVTGHRGMLRTRVLEVEGADGRLRRDQLAHRTPLADAIFFLRTTFVLEPDLRHRTVHGLGKRAVVAHVQRVTLGRMLVPVAVARRLPAPMQVVVVSLPTGPAALNGHRVRCVVAANEPLPSG
ncbi:hypothetical protein D3C85_1023730 [compost metagenome]